MVKDSEARPGWRDVVQRAARDAAVLETRAGRGQGAVLFNYRWEHVQAVVQLAVRLAFKQLIHPEGMGETFKVLVQAKGVGGATLSGLAAL